MAVQVIALNKSGRYAGESVVKVNSNRCRKKAIEAGENDTRHGNSIRVIEANK